MKIRLSCAVLACVIATAITPRLDAAQAPAAPQQPTVPARPAVPSRPASPAAPAEPALPELPAIPAIPAGRSSFGRDAIRIGQDFVLRNGDVVRDAVVILGDATIEGRVEQNVVVVLGNVRVTDTAIIDRSLVVIGGSVTAAANARIDEDLVIVGGGLEGAPGFQPQAQYVVIGSEVVGGRLQGLVPWLTRGLLWGRLIVPDLGWVWGIVLLFFLAYAALNLLFGKAVGSGAHILTEKPLSAFAAGMLTLLLVGPVCVILAVSVVGIAVIPFVICALIVTGIIGRVAVARWIGMRAVAETDSDSKLQSLRSFAIGFAVVCVALMIPIVGLITWVTLGVLGLGAAALAFLDAYRRENPARPRKTSPPVPPAVAAAQTFAPVAAQATSYPAVPVGEYQTVAEPVPGLSGTGDDDSSPIPPPPMPQPSAARGGSAAADLLAFPRAAFRDRFAAVVLDLILIVFVYNLLAFSRPIYPNIFFTMLIGYHVGFWVWKSTTVGGIILNLRVVRMDGYRLRFADALVRGLSGIFSALVIGLGFLWILKDPERQAWHDRIAGTYVLKVPREFPL